ncbi:MAG TPA: response regulator, partial [Gemmatimonadaceae bacterium]
MSSSHVLVVEDNHFVSGALRILLESADHRVSIAATVAESMGLATSDVPTLALIDLTLPDGDGLALVEPLFAAGCKTV